MKNKAFNLLLAAILLTSAGLAQEPVRFVNLVGVGDSLMAGFQSGVIKEEGQVNSFASLVAQRAGTFFFLPLLPNPGFGAEITLVDGVPTQGPPTFGAPGARGFPLIIPQNLAIPGQDVGEALMVRPNLPIDSLEDVILGIPILVAPIGIPPLSQIELAVGLQPTFTLFWLGSNDVLGAALAGDASLATPLDQFQMAYATSVGALLTLTSTRMVLANIPDVTVIPYLTPAEEVAAAAGAPLEVIGPALGIAAGDLVTAPGIPLVTAILTGQTPGPLPPSVVLTADEVGALRLRTAQMNGFIGALAAQLNLPVVDINGILNQVDQEGIPVGGVTLTTDFLGGLFSLDGIHPTNTGHAILANAFIERINAFYGLSIPPVDVAAILANDPLAPTADFGDAPKVMSMGKETYENLKAIFGPRQFDGEEKESAPGRSFAFDWLLPRVRSLLDEFPRYSISPGPVWRELETGVEDARRLEQPSGN